MSAFRTLTVNTDFATLDDSEFFVASPKTRTHDARVWFRSDVAPRVVSRNGDHYRMQCADVHTSPGESEPRLWIFLVGVNKRTGADYKSGKGVWTTFGPGERLPQHWLGESFDVVEQFCVDAGLLVADEPTTPVCAHGFALTSTMCMPCRLLASAAEAAARDAAAAATPCTELHHNCAGCGTNDPIGFVSVDADGYVSIEIDSDVQS